MTPRETDILREIGEEVSAATPEDQRCIAAMIEAFRAGVRIGETRAAS